MARMRPSSTTAVFGWGTFAEVETKVAPDTFAEVEADYVGLTFDDAEARLAAIARLATMRPKEV